MMNDKLVEKARIESLKAEDIKQAYSGKAGHCCCGCSGKHSESIAAKRWQVRMFRLNSDKVLDLGTCWSLEIDGRLYNAYFS